MPNHILSEFLGISRQAQQTTGAEVGGQIFLSHTDRSSELDEKGSLRDHRPLLPYVKAWQKLRSTPDIVYHVSRYSRANFFTTSDFQNITTFNYCLTARQLRPTRILCILLVSCPSIFRHLGSRSFTDLVIWLVPSETSLKSWTRCHPRRRVCPEL